MRKNKPPNKALVFYVKHHHKFGRDRTLNLIDWILHVA